MAFRHGKNGQLTVNSGDLSTFITNCDLSIDIDTADSTTFGSSWKSALPGTAGAKLDFSGFYDPTNSTGTDAILWTVVSGAAAVACVYKPGGTLAGQRTYSFNAILTNLAVGGTVGGLVTTKGSLLVTGAITPTTQ